MRKNLLARASAFAVACASLAGAAAAAETVVSDVIVVTAQFREQNVLEVPIAVTAYDGRFLETIGVDSFEQLSAYVPGFVVQEQSVNNPGFVLRGITSDDGAANIEPRVSVFQNGVSISRSRGSIVQLHDIERVEALKGPQGTLFGRSAQIGAVHVITNKPTYEMAAGFSAEFGNYGYESYKGFVNAPLVDGKLALRAAVAYKQRDGFIANPLGDALNGTDTLSVRGSARAEPADNLRIDIIGNYSKDKPPGTSFKSGVIPALGGDTDPNAFATLNTFGNFLGGAPLGVEREIKDLTAIVSWKISDAWTLTSTSSWREFSSLEVFDPDGSALAITIFAEDAKGEQWSSDIRFAFDNGGRVAGFFGGGVFSEKGTQSVPLGLNVGEAAGLILSLAQVSDPVNGVAFFGGNPALVPAYLSGDPATLAAVLGFAGIPSGLYQQERFANGADNFSFDLFGELSFALSDRLTFTAGGRWTRDRKESLFASEIQQANPFTPLIIGAPSLLVGNSGGFLSSDDYAVDNTFGGFSWRAVLNWEFADGKYAYFNHSRGRRPEVLQDSFSAAPGGGVAGEFAVVPAETVSSYEIGLKGRFLDGLATLESAAYYYGYNNFQSSVLRDLGSGPPTFEILNAGSATSYGVEVGLNLQPSDGLEVFATYGWNHGRFDDTDADGNAQIYAGNRFRLSPDHALSAGFTWRRDTSFGRLFLTPTYTWKSSVYFEDDNTDAYDVVLPGPNTVLYSVPAIAQEAYGLLNIRAGVELAGGAVGFEGFVQNLLDKEFIIDAGNTGGGFGIPTYIAGPPRFYGGGVKVRF